VVLQNRVSNMVLSPEPDTLPSHHSNILCSDFNVLLNCPATADGRDANRLSHVRAFLAAPSGTWQVRGTVFRQQRRRMGARASTGRGRALWRGCALSRSGVSTNAAWPASFPCGAREPSVLLATRVARMQNRSAHSTSKQRSATRQPQHAGDGRHLAGANRACNVDSNSKGRVQGLAARAGCKGRLTVPRDLTSQYA
jgi:hypothetical protein